MIVQKSCSRKPKYLHNYLKLTTKILHAYSFNIFRKSPKKIRTVGNLHKKLRIFCNRGGHILSPPLQVGLTKGKMQKASLHMILVHSTLAYLTMISSRNYLDLYLLYLKVVTRSTYLFQINFMPHGRKGIIKILVFQKEV